MHHVRQVAPDGVHQAESSGAATQSWPKTKADQVQCTWSAPSRSFPGRQPGPTA